jgi:hypothetical protein
MIRVAAKTCLSSATEIGDRTVKFFHWVVQVLVSMFIVKEEVSYPGGFLVRSEHDEEVIRFLSFRNQQQ